jgi:molybdopterin synthase sulfur carrier subunit
LLTELSDRHGERLGSVLARCSFLLDGEQLPRTSDRALPADGELDVLPPFAGG